MIRLIIIFLFVNTTTHAHQVKVGTVGATIGPFIYQTHGQSVKSNPNSPPLFGLGILAEGDVNSSGGIEIGLIYTQKVYSRAAEGTYISEKIYKLEIPMGYRHWLSDRFSVGLFITSSYSVGDYAVVYDNTAAGSGTTSAREIAEYGFDGSFQWEFFKSGPNCILADARYFYSMVPKPNEDANRYGILIGYKYMIQEK